MTSPDGITWTIRTSAADNSWVLVTYGNNLFVAVSDSGDINPPIYTRSIPMYFSVTITVIDVSSNITSTYGNVPFIYNYLSNNPSIPTYSSSNTSVATINSSGLVTILSGGTTTLTINQSSTENYTDGSANSILTIQPDITVINVSSNITSTYGNVPFIYNYLSNNPSIPTYSSSNTSVASINSSGLVTILSGGTTTLTINQSSTENYTDGSANSILTVQSNSNSNPVVITNGNGLEYFLTTNSIYAILSENININENLVNQGNATKIISSNSFCKIYK
jgi:PHD/YefM family antitoxin component YafN of YafNO toxin-antitoxin module